MGKVKVSHTIEKKQLKWIDAEILKKRFASRSHAIGYALEQLINSEKPNKKKAGPKGAESA